MCGFFAYIFFVNASWRSGRDSNPRGIAPKLISSQPRYDHFDTAAWCIPNGLPAHRSGRAPCRNRKNAEDPQTWDRWKAYMLPET